MLETLLTILAWNCSPFAPDILLEKDGDIELSWYSEETHAVLDISITSGGKINWAGYRPDGFKDHGTDMDRCKNMMEILFDIKELEKP